MTTLKLGSKGEEVEKLQKALGLKADGIFGPNTEKAVKEFQKKNNLTSDGIAGSKTLALLFAENDSIEIIRMPLKVHITKKANRPITYLAIHYTAGASSKKGSARNVYNVFTTNASSADFAVDDEEIIQFNPDIKNYYCWAIGDNGGNKLIKNSNTINIEMCSNLTKGTTAKVPNHEGWTFTEKTIENAAKLASFLMEKHCIPKENVLRHYDVTKKMCPGIIGWNDECLYDSKTGKRTANKNNSKEWEKFKERLR